MIDIIKIIRLIDIYLEEKQIPRIEANEVARYLDKKGVLNYSTKGQPLRKLLRGGKIPNAEQPGGKNTNWYIRHSKDFEFPSAPKKMTSLPTSAQKVSDIGRKYCLSSISDANSEILILGTLPANKSLEKGEYYANPKNQFWLILSKLYNKPVPESYKERIIWLKKHRIALWDVLESANRDGNLDILIDHPQPNDILGFINSHPSLRVIVLNGTGDTYDYFNMYVDVKYIPKRIRILPLPSTSSSNTHFSVEEKAEQWRAIL